MPRGLSEAYKVALASRAKGIVYCVELMTATPVRVWTGVGSLTTLGQTWLGLGEFGVISGVQSDMSLRAQSISFSIVGLPNDAITAGLIAGTRGERYQGLDLTVYLGITNADTGALVGDPVAVWTGLADVLSFRRGESVSATLTGEHLSSRMRRAPGFRMTTASHNARLSGVPSDTFFDAADRLMGIPKAGIS